MRDPLILTAAFDAHAGEQFQALRNRHFPAERNIVPAHLTLFHNLPGEELHRVEDDLGEACADLQPFPFVTAGPRFLGHGSALEIAASNLVQLRADLAKRWRDWMTNQDRQGFRPHVTVQNKVSAEVARALCGALAGLPPMSGTIDGLDLWFYRGGPWERAARFSFGVGARS